MYLLACKPPWTTFILNSKSNFKKYDPTLAFSVNPLVCVSEPLRSYLHRSRLLFPQRYHLKPGRMEAFLRPGPPAPVSFSSCSKSQQQDLQGAEGNIKYHSSDMHERLWQCCSVQEACWRLRQDRYRWIKEWGMDGWIPWTNVHPLWLGHVQGEKGKREEACWLFPLQIVPQLHI